MTITRGELVARHSPNLDEAAPVVDWQTFLRWFRWRQGEHVGIIGPTGQGKTTFAFAILPKRRFITVLATKPRDETLERFARQENFEIIQRWDDKADPLLKPRRMLWPNAKSLYAAFSQRSVFRRALSSIYNRGNWAVYLDELWYMVHHLKLETEVRVYLLQARSNGVSLIVATQRPAHVPLEVYDQSSWLVFFRDNDETNLKRISGISWLSKKLVQTLVANLDEFQALVINTRTGRMVRTTVERREGLNA
jgi:hypothetical protein